MPRRGNNHEAMNAPTMPTTRSPKRPKPAPRTTLPASQPATMPTTRITRMLSVDMSMTSSSSSASRGTSERGPPQRGGFIAQSGVLGNRLGAAAMAAAQARDAAQSATAGTNAQREFADAEPRALRRRGWDGKQVLQGIQPLEAHGVRSLVGRQRLRTDAAATDRRPLAFQCSVRLKLVNGETRRIAELVGSAEGVAREQAGAGRAGAAGLPTDRAVRSVQGDLR